MICLTYPQLPWDVNICSCIYQAAENYVTSNKSQLCAHYGYDLSIFPALATLEYQIYSGYKIQGGIGDNLASPRF